MPRQVEYTHYAAGVRVTRTPDARGYYRIRFTRPDGTPGEARRSTQEDAHALALELSGLIGKQQSGAARLADRPVSELIEVWLEGEHGTPTYRKSSRSMLRARIAPVLGPVPAGEWDQAATKRVIDACLQHGLAESTVSNVVRLMSHLAAVGREHGYLEPGTNPVKGVWRHRRSYVDLDELPTADDVEKLAITAAATLGQDWRATQVYCGAYSGLRIGEVLGLQVRDIDLEAGTIKVERQVDAATSGLVPPKYGSVRTTVFPVWLDDAWSEVVSGRDPAEPAFPARRGTHERYSTFYNQRWRPTVAAAGLLEDGSPRWTYHDLRHYFCTWTLSKQGLDLDVADVARMAGHRSPETTWETYVQPRPDLLGRARGASRGGAR